jgi:ribosomal protein S4
LENRLDILLYRTNLFESIFAVRVFLRNKNVLINGQIVTNKNISVNLGDIILIKPSVYKNLHKIFQERLRSKRLLINFPKYLEVDYSLGAFILIKLPKEQEISYPSGLQLKNVLHRYNK